MPRDISPEAFLANLPLFKGLGQDCLARLAAGATRLSLRRGDAVFKRGETPQGICAVVHGEVKLVGRTPAGAPKLHDLIGPGMTFGAPVMFLGRAYIVDAAATRDSLVLRVAKKAILAEIERSPRFALRLLGALSARLEHLVREREAYALTSAAERFIAWLLRNERAVAGPANLVLPAAKKSIASRLNLSPEHFSRVLAELAARGLIVVRGRTIEVIDLARLRAYRARGPRLSSASARRRR